MCGIGGIISDNAEHLSCINKMSDTIRHRGPDDEGYSLVNIASKDISQFSGRDSKVNNQDINAAAFNSFHLGLLHRRLSILDLSPASHQPMVSNDNKLALTYNGEIYNFKEIKSELENLGHQFNSQGDTEVILKSYSQWGISCVNKFRGMWAFAIIDLKSMKLFLSRDRFGIKPLYYTTNGSQFSFCSEIKGLLSLPQVSAKANLHNVTQYLVYGANERKAGLFENIQELGQGENLTLDLSSATFNINKYYELNENNISITDPVESFENALSESVRLHSISDVQIGSCLSGGLDSSALIRLLSEQLNQSNIKTFTSSFDNPIFDESNYAKEVVDSRKNVNGHYTFPSAKGLWESFDALTWHQDLPIHSSSMYAQWEVMKLAKENNIKVLLNGQGADEVLGGYYNFAGIYLLSLSKRFQFLKFLKQRSLLKQNFTPNIDNALLRALYYHLPSGIQGKFRSPQKISYQCLTNSAKSVAQQIADLNRTDTTYTGLSVKSVTYGLQDLLRYEDRSSMAHSIESRVPFLDHKLVETCLALPVDEKIKGGWTKSILRRINVDKLPSRVVWRKDKMGFLTPQQNWKNELSAELNQYLNSCDIPDILDKQTLLTFTDLDFKGNSSKLTEYWRMISVIKWFNKFDVSI